METKGELRGNISGCVLFSFHASALTGLGIVVHTAEKEASIVNLFSFFFVVVDNWKEQPQFSLNPLCETVVGSSQSSI